VIPATADNRPVRILVVDDSRVMRQIVARTLRQAGFAGHDVVEAANGVEGLTAAARENPDLVLSDWNMPEMDGFEMLTALRARGDVTPFGFVAPKGSSEMVSRAEAAGALFFISKPFTVGVFREKLRPVLG
jgi:two-component system chemotaxis response regulator CheY